MQVDYTRMNLGFFCVCIFTSIQTPKRTKTVNEVSWDMILKQKII